MVREALSRILEASGNIHVVAQASDGMQALQVVQESRPEVVVLDYSMPSKDAIAVMEKLFRLYPEIKVLVLTVHENVHYAVRVLEAGAHGYLIKSAAVDELVRGIEAVHQGGIFISPRVAQEVLQRLRQPKRNRIGLESLSQREFDLLRMLGAGISLQSCAKKMNVSTSTASTYRARIMEKLNLASTAEVIRYALENGIAD